ncbi:MAG: UvrY/SirA/GacA family response regulator transcription factor [Pseudomonadales bacterium]
MIRVLIADDHKLFRIGLQKMLRESSEIRVVGEATTGEEAVSLARERGPNVVLMDLAMPGIGGLEATRRILRLQNDIRVIAVTAFEDSPYPVQALKAGALGYLTKKVNADELLKAVKRVFLGKRYLSAEVAQQLAVTSVGDDGDDPFSQLSGREMQIMLMVVNCHKVREISSNLHLSPKTVNSYRYRIFEKLNVSSDVELALLAVRHGMLHGGSQHEPAARL